MKVWPARLVSCRGSISEHVVITWPREIPPAAALRMRISTHGCVRVRTRVCAVCIEVCIYLARAAGLVLQR